MRNISFSLTTAQVIARSKTVTRRQGWENLKPGELLQGCEKCMGRRHGEPLIRLAVIEIVSVVREPLSRLLADPYGGRKHTQSERRFTEYAHEEMTREGFPGKSPLWFVEMFCNAHKGCTPSTIITRIEFRYV